MTDSTGVTSTADTDQAGIDDAKQHSSVGELVVQASAQLTDLVRSEMELDRAELQASVKRAGTGAGLFGASGLMAFYGGPR